MIWDTKTGRELRRVELPARVLGLLAWLADGRGIALLRSYDEPAPARLGVHRREGGQTGGEVALGPAGFGTTAIDPNQQVVDNEHDGCYAISPDGKVLVIGKAGQLQSDREVQLWS